MKRTATKADRAIRSRGRARLSTSVVLLTTAMLTVAACGSSGGSSDNGSGSTPSSNTSTSNTATSSNPAPAGTTASGGGEKAEIRFSWWGNQARADLTQKAIDAFEAANPNITVKTEWTDFNSYFDKLSTEIAAGNGPDVITLGGAYPGEYGGRGALLDLTKVSDNLHTDKIAKAALAAGNFDGVQYGVPTGVNVYLLMANPAIFKAAGVAMPDDNTWTWDDYTKIATEISKKAPKGTYGAADPTKMDLLGLYSGQQGESFYTKDGKLGVTEGTVEKFWNMTLGMMESGATPPASLTQELVTQTSPEQTLLGQGKAAMDFAYSNQVGEYEKACGCQLQLLRVPGETGHPGMTFMASQLYTINSKSKHTDAAAKLVNFLINDPAAGKAILADRGMPSNPDVLDAINSVLPPDAQQQAEFIKREGPLAAPPAVVGPPGSTDSTKILQRLNAQVLFKQISPAAAAKSFMSQLNAAIQQ